MVMIEQQGKIARKNQDTYVYIDVSNIRWACQKTLDFRIDFVRLLDYFKQKYPNLKEVRYYEGMASGDAKKQRMFNFLKRKGYIICSLKRKSYNTTETEERDVKCPECGHEWTAEFTREHKAMKSNVDVYLASDMIAQVATTDRPTRLILVSCDGDYAEAIKVAIQLNENISVAVLATPPVKDITKNTLSVRLKALRSQTEHYKLQNIDDIRSLIESDKQQ